MFNFIVQIALMASLAIIVYMLARALPRVVHEQSNSEEQNSLDRFVKRIPLERLDSSLQRFFIKFLRKTRVLIAKFDNLLNEYINGLKKNSIAQSPQESIKEKMDLLVNGASKQSDEEVGDSSPDDHQNESI